MFDLILRKTQVIFGTGLVMILSSKLVSACTLQRGSTIIEDNKFEAQIYFSLSIIILIAVSILYFITKKYGLVAIIVSSLIVLLHPAWRFEGGGGDCGESFVEIAKLLFGLSLLTLAVQTVSLIVQKSKL